MTQRIVLTTYFCLSFYCFGALVVENDVNYNTWLLIGNHEFPAYHQNPEALLGPVFMLPLTLLLIVSIVLLWVRPYSIKLLDTWIVIILNAYIIAESMLVQVPIHKQLSVEKTPLLIETLIRTHIWYRLPAEVLLFAFNIYLLYKVLPAKRAELEKV